MNTRLPCSLVASAMILVIAATPAVAGYPGHEVWLGFGGATSFEKDVFNVPSDIESSPEVAVTLGYMKNLDARKALGFHIYGTAETTEPVAVTGPAGTQVVEFDLSTFNIGVRFRYTFSRGGWVPYAFVGASWANGSIDAPEMGTLNYSGISGCFGPGAAVPLGRHFVLSAELFGSFGVANWESTPFNNSSGKEFNPSIAGGTVSMSFVWSQRE